jgi:O-antigen/teichoic acid export membrane protein
MSAVLERRQEEPGLEPRSIARDAGLNLVARLFAMACSSVTALVVAGSLERSAYGAYAIAVGISAVLVMGLDLGLTSSVARFVAQGRAGTRLVLAVALVRLAIIALVALLILAGPFDGGSAVGDLMPALALLVVAQSLIAFHFGALPSLRRIRLLLLVTVLQPAAELTLVLLARARDGGPEAMLLATALAALGVSLLAWLLLLAPGRAAAGDVSVAPQAEQATLRMVRDYGLRIFLVSLLIALIGQIDQFVIGLFHPLAEVAPYALAIKLQALIAAPAITVAAIVAPRIAGAGADALRLYRQWLAFLVAIALGAVAVMAVLSAEIFGAIGAQYRGESELLVAMGPFLVLSALAPLPSIALNQTGHAGRRMRVAAITLAINAGLDLALVPPLGAWGAVVGTTVAFAYYFVRHHALLQDALRTGPHNPSPPLAKGVVSAALVATGAALLAAAIRGVMDAVGAPSDIAVLIVAGTLPVLLVAWWSSRIVRRPFG